MLRILISNVATDFCFFRLFVRTRCKPCRKHETIQSASLDGYVYLVVWDSFISCFVYFLNKQTCCHCKRTRRARQHNSRNLMHFATN